MSLNLKTIAELRDGFRAGDFSAREVAESFNAAVAAGRALNAYTVETPEAAAPAKSPIVTPATPDLGTALIEVRPVERRQLYVDGNPVGAPFE